MSTDADVRDCIERAADAVGPVWPLHSFVTANPLAGFEDRPFHEAVREGRTLFSGNGYPGADTFREAWTTGRIDPEILERELTAHGYEMAPERQLERMDADDGTPDSTGGGDGPTAADRLDDLVTKWLETFLDQGKAHWPMPNREAGFYAAVREVARHDRTLPDRHRLGDLPSDPVEALERLLEDHPKTRWPAIFEHHLAALPGWTGFVTQRTAAGDDWQSTYPITLAGYLAVRLAFADLLDIPIAPLEATDRDHTGGRTTEPRERADDGDGVPLPEAWLSAWEATYRRELVDAVSEASAARAATDGTGRPAAQLVFCIDTRSEIIRRHVEAAGDYETHGYAGFFGIPMRYAGYDTVVTVDACPPILDAEHRIADRPTDADRETQARHDRWSAVTDAGRDIVDALKTNAATAFSFVESAGLGYGSALATRTLVPARVYDLLDRVDSRVPGEHEFCAPTVDHDPDDAHALPLGLTLAEKVGYAAAAFDLMGWEQFARVVVFVGHASETTNNPFDSSLDCGACAGNPGGPSARVLATICNDPEVRAELAEQGIDIPDDTVFVAGEHNTTTDEVELYASDIPDSHESDVEQLRADLETARAGAASERAGDMGATDRDGIRETTRRAADWAETRPEWGLAGNAAVVVGPRDLTADLDLDGRAFLHSYDPATDPEGEALEAIMAGPMVVTQWINTQYYFATVDTSVYGSGSKVTQNPVGNVGVYQGNGGDLLTGLPLQSVAAAADEPYHQPIRLSTVIHAPVDRVTDILADHDELTTLLDNGWLSLTVVDPQQNHQPFHYTGDLSWVEGSSRLQKTGAPTPNASAEDD